MIQTTAAGAMRETVEPELGQGDTEDRPMPAPRAIRLNESAAATNAPATTAAQETPELVASTGCASVVGDRRVIVDIGRLPFFLGS